MTTAELLESESESQYRALVLSAARGEAIDSAQLRELLLLSGRPAGDFGRHVAQLKTRLAAAQQYQGTALANEIKQAGAELYAAQTRLASARQEAMPYVAAERAAGAEVGTAKRTLEELEHRQRQQRTTARQELLRGVDPEIDVEINRLQQRCSVLRKSIAGTKSLSLDKARQQLQAFKDKTADHARREEPVESRLVAEKLPAAEGRVRTLEGMYAALPDEENELAELQQRVEVLEATKLLTESINWNRPTAAEPKAADLVVA